MHLDAALTIGAMRVDDLAAVLDIQRQCHDAAKQESGESFLAKLRASPQTCFVARAGTRTVGHLVSVPAMHGSPLPLDSPTCVCPAAPDSLYLHDLAVDPAARGLGVAAALLAAYRGRLREAGLAQGSLIAVNDSAGFWRRHGFREVEPAGMGRAHLAAYGQDARYMVGPRGTLLAAA